MNIFFGTNEGLALTSHVTCHFDTAVLVESRDLLVQIAYIGRVGLVNIYLDRPCLSLGPISVSCNVHRRWEY